MIEISALKKTFGQLTVLDNINLKVQQGEIFGLAGRSGAGKSTLLRCINGLEKYDSGFLKVCATEVGTLSEKDLRTFRRNVGMVFQNFSLLSRATVYDNIALAMRIWNCEKTLIDKRIKELLHVVEIPEKIQCKARELSGGQKQRVAIARALAMNPSVLLCDEATSALDPKSTMAIISLLKDINKRFDITIVMVTHEMDVVKSLCDSMAIIEDGVMKATGSVQDVFLEHPLALQNLLGSKSASIPSDGRSFELLYDRRSADAVLFTRMARELNIDFKILGNNTLALKEKTIESVVVNAQAKDASRICGYLDSHSIAYKEITPEKSL